VVLHLKSNELQPCHDGNPMTMLVSLILETENAMLGRGVKSLSKIEPGYCTRIYTSMPKLKVLEPV